MMAIGKLAKTMDQLVSVFKAKGIDKERLERLSYGDEQLKKSKKDSRRVEIAIVGADA